MADMVVGVADGVVLSKPGYRRLVRDVGAMLEAGRAEAERAVGSVLALTYWQVGQRIVQEGMSARAGYGDAVLKRLAAELSMELRTLQRVVQFARMYPERPADGLSWGHYRELLRVRDAQARQWYGAQAATQGWTMRALAAAVKGDAFEVERGTGKGTGKGTLVRPKVATPFLFAGEVLRVLDGDTVEMRLDLGFDVWRVQPIRFAGVDAAPVQTAAGAAARDYVLERLCRAPWTVVMTEQYDIHMRYVGHVFYAHREMTREEVFARGRYLNGELLDRGLAQRYA